MKKVLNTSVIILMLILSVEDVLFLKVFGISLTLDDVWSYEWRKRIKLVIIIYLILQDNFGRISIFANQSLSVFLHSNNRCLLYTSDAADE